MTRNWTAALCVGVSCLFAQEARADESGISFWLPGLYGSFAAVPAQPGWSFATVYIHPSVSAGASEAFTRGGGGQVDLGIKGRGNLLAFGPTYTFEQPLWNGQFAVSLLGVAGRSHACVDATLTGPLGGSVSGERCDSRTAFGDLLPQATLKWNDGVDNYLAYITGDIPVGAYDSDRLANLGIGHGAIDGGVGYTYLDVSTGREFSIVGGLTYNFENPDTDYQNGVDAHIDWGASQFLNEHLYVGVAGYAYQQITGDSGAGASLGDFKSRVFGVGPQVGYNFDVNDKTSGFLNLKGYYEFGAKNRPEGWNVWLSLAFAPRAPKKVE
ncbi:phenol degradation protein meta (plasmid) [Rhizobium grahamii]|uniref:Phenol degradation protein meta n=1 Tax=Rhizobium grahamii TaxID=1120045 RepID=A0A5Q0CFJ9_9HYPH|nr:MULTISPECIES: transporter [Rhizobium]QFY62900.1 phenol degradation protein meta [Rhizobium grahamii]QRM52349.1 phenol degradation protein meta [Rhizobium sp. BG6]